MGSPGLRVNAIAPCQFMTPGCGKSFAIRIRSPKNLWKPGRPTPLGRVGESEEIVGPGVILGLFRCSSMVTGRSWMVDGALSRDDQWPEQERKQSPFGGVSYRLEIWNWILLNQSKLIGICTMDLWQKGGGGLAPAVSTGA